MRPPGVERDNSLLHGPHDIIVSLSLPPPSLPIHCGLTIPYPKPSGPNIFWIRNVSYIGKVIRPTYYILCNTLSEVWVSTPIIKYGISGPGSMMFSSSWLKKTRHSLHSAEVKFCHQMSPAHGSFCYHVSYEETSGFQTFSDLETVATG